MKIMAPAGMEDLLPGRVAQWRRVESTVRRVMESYGYGEIRTPALESTSLFVRSVGEATDIVEKEMYTFDSRSNQALELLARVRTYDPTTQGTELLGWLGEESTRKLLEQLGNETDGDSVTLRPELTAPIVRACLEHSLFAKRPFHKLYYLGALFRRERPQKGRLRQFHQLGVEALGSGSPALDAETIELAAAILDALELREYTVRLNSTGCATCRAAYREVLREKAAPELDQMCPDCRSRHARNPFRILDCKRETCRPVIQRLPSIQDHLCEGCRMHHQTVTGTLTRAGIRFVPDPLLVRGLDYYTRTVYELTYPSLGAQNAIGGGGRYDGLISDLGGPETGAVGFAMGIERIFIALDALGGGRDPEADHIAPVALYVTTVDDALRPQAAEFLRRARRAGISADTDYEGKSLKAQMRNANRLQARWVVVFGPEEAARGEARLKSMTEKVEESLPLDAILARIQEPRTGAHG